MPSKLCESCVHTKVCMLDKNLVGDVFVMGNPDFFDNEKLYEEYKKREQAGFPCTEYLTADVKPVVRGSWVGIDDEPCEDFECDKCGYIYYTNGYELYFPRFCPNCGASMVRGEQDERYDIQTGCD